MLVDYFSKFSIIKIEKEINSRLFDDGVNFLFFYLQKFCLICGRTKNPLALAIGSFNNVFII